MKSCLKLIEGQREHRVLTLGVGWCGQLYQCDLATACAMEMVWRQKKGLILFSVILPLPSITSLLVLIVSQRNYYNKLDL